MDGPAEEDGAPPVEVPAEVDAASPVNGPAEEGEAAPGGTPTGGGASGAGATTFRVMDVMGVTLELPDQYPVLRLQEAEPPMRTLAFRIGMPEGVALAYALRRLDTPRPLTHELLAEIVRRLGADVVAVRLVGRSAGTYLAELDLMGREGREVVPCRPTDGIILALRQRVPAPVLADVRLLEEGGDVVPAS